MIRQRGPSHPYQCGKSIRCPVPDCKKTLKQNKVAEAHLKSHSELADGPWKECFHQCAMCEFYTIQKSNLLSHMWTRHGFTPSDLRHDLTDPCAPSPTPYFGPHNYQRVTQIRQLPLGSLTENGLKIELEHPPSQWFPFHEAASADTPVNAPPPVAPISYRTPDRNQHIAMQSQVNSLHAQQDVPLSDLGYNVTASQLSGNDDDYALYPSYMKQAEGQGFCWRDKYPLVARSTAMAPSFDYDLAQFHPTPNPQFYPQDGLSISGSELSSTFDAPIFNDSNYSLLSSESTRSWFLG